MAGKIALFAAELGADALGGALGDVVLDAVLAPLCVYLLLV